MSIQYEPTPPEEAPTRARIVGESIGETGVLPPPSSPPPVVPPRRVGPFGRWVDPTDRLGLALLAILLAAAGIVVAAIVLTRDDDKSTTNPAPAATTTAPSPAPRTDVAVPTLAGTSRADATAALESAGFAVVVATVPGPPPAGQVLAQSPAAGEQHATGSTVRINVSDGTQTGGATTPASTTATQPTTAPPTTTAPAQPSSVQVPGLTGDVKSAAQRLAAAGLLASIQYVPGSDPLGTVLAQSPPDGATATRDSHVTISVSSGPGDNEQKTVPDTAGQTIPQAVETLNRAGLRLILLKRTVGDQTQAGKVVEQTPRPNEQAPKNAQVLVYMGAYKG